MIIVSACLCGVNCKYNGKNNLNLEVLKLVKEGKAIPVCPEQLGGLPTPRIVHEIKNGDGKDVLMGKAKVINPENGDSTERFLKGAYETLSIAKSVGAKMAILKDKSPSCGCKVIYDGTFTGCKIKGNGVTTQLLLDNGVKVLSEEDYIR